METAPPARRGGVPACPTPTAARILFGAALLALTATTGSAGNGDGDVLRRMAQAEKDAGRLSAFHLAEVYRAIGVTMAPAAPRAPREVELETARTWARQFCDAASRSSSWGRPWKLIVHAYGRSDRLAFCEIPAGAVSAEEAEMTSTEGR